MNKLEVLLCLIYLKEINELLIFQFIIQSLNINIHKFETSSINMTAGNVIS